MNLELVDLAMRGAATGIALILVGLVANSRIARIGRLVFAMTVVCLIARLWSTTPSVHLNETALFSLRIIASGGVFFLTWFLVLIFLDNTRFGWAWLASSGAIMIGILSAIALPAIVPYLRGLAVLHFTALLALVVLTARDDLQEARRTMRPAIATFLIFYAIGNALTSGQLRSGLELHTAFGQSAATLALLAVFAFWALKVNVQNWPVETVANALAPTPQQRQSENNILIKRIKTEMQAGVWQLEGLTVGALAQRVKAPEHQVRRAINQVLGHRNFASFINSARIEAAKAKLADPENTGLTILEIAYEVGFASLGPFNRAFRDATGQAPTDYRKSALEALKS